MKFDWNKKYLTIALLSFFVIALGILFYGLVNNFFTVLAVIAYFIGILSPILMGFAFAFILAPILTFFDTKCFPKLLKKMKNKKKAKKLIRGLSVFCTLLIALLVIGAILWFLIPQIVKSILGMVDGIPSYVENIKAFALNFASSNPELSNYFNQSFTDVDAFLQSYAPNLSTWASGLTMSVGRGLFSAIMVVKDVLIGLVISAYIMYSKETFCSQTKKLTFAIFSRKIANKLLEVTYLANKIFSGFISGQMLDALIVGTICFIFTSIVGIPYAPLISIIIAITNIIPVIGPFLGTIPVALILLLDNPMNALIFVIFIIILQQIDGNIIAPKILGGSTGLSPFWVLFAIFIGGGLFGIPGIFLGVPTFALIFTLVSDFIKNRLTKKGLPNDVSSYDGKDEPSV